MRTPILFALGVAGSFAVVGAVLLLPRYTMLEEAKAAVRNTLNDPGSAQFEDLRQVATEKNPKLVCGYVNAKNKLGGYVGRAPFFYDGTSACVLSNFTAAFLCSNAGTILQCFPQFPVPRNASDAMNWDRNGPPGR